MRLPLLAAARPRTAKCGPIVPLPSGMWRIFAEQLKDTVLELFINDASHSTLIAGTVYGYTIEGPCNAQVLFTKRGSEEYINVSAERLSGRNLSC